MGKHKVINSRISKDTHTHTKRLSIPTPFGPVPIISQILYCADIRIVDT